MVFIKHSLTSRVLQITDKVYLKREMGFVFLKKDPKGEEKAMGIPTAHCNFLHVLHSGSEQALLGNLRNPHHGGIIY